MRKLSAKAIQFLTSESGAVTVDWVVLTAAVVGLGVATVSSVRSGVADLGGDISTSLSGTEVASLTCLGDNAGQAGFACYNGPTISGAGPAEMWMSMPMCWMTLEGSGGCTPGSQGTSQEFQMSDGSTYTRSTTTTGNTTTEYWTDSSGNFVDAPPPMPDGSYNYTQISLLD